MNLILIFLHHFTKKLRYVKSKIFHRWKIVIVRNTHLLNILLHLIIPNLHKSPNGPKNRLTAYTFNPAGHFLEVNQNSTQLVRFNIANSKSKAKDAGASLLPLQQNEPVFMQMCGFYRRLLFCLVG